MTPVQCFSIVVGLVILTGVLLKFFVYTNTIGWALGFWLTINLFVAIYQLFAVTHRQRMSRNYCLNPLRDMWTRKDYTPMEKQLWVDAWTDYSCHADARFMDPRSIVHVIQVMNMFIVFGMFAVLALADVITQRGGDVKGIIVNLLALQSINALLYVATLIYHMTKLKTKPKHIVYYAGALLWVLIPIAFVVMHIAAKRW